ncbi:MAG: VOC family protein [Paludibaculum sp.]
MTTAHIPIAAATTVGAVSLTVASLSQAVEFYTSRLGLQVLKRLDEAVHLGVGSVELLVLHGNLGARRVPRTAGLYHFAILLPSRRALGAALKHLIDSGVPLQGAADHLVSEAIYLADPEGNGIELYHDRDRAEWPVRDGQIQMATDPLDAQGVLASAIGAPTNQGLPEGTRMGHIHLHVGDIAEAEAFYHGVLGFDITLRYGRSASFLSAGGYHHHVAVNTWAGVGAKPNPEGAMGLKEFSVVVPDTAELRRIAAITSPLEDNGGDILLRDPSGNAVRITAGL